MIDTRHTVRTNNCVYGKNRERLRLQTINLLSFFAKILNYKIMRNDMVQRKHVSHREGFLSRKTFFNSHTFAIILDNTYASALRIVCPAR